LAAYPAERHPAVLRLIGLILLSASACFAQAPPKVTITNACCSAIPHLEFRLQGATEAFSLPFGVSSIPLTVNAGQSSLEVRAGGEVLYTSASFSLAQGKEYTLAFYGTIRNYQIIGPGENLTDGDQKKIRIRLVFLSPYVQQKPAPTQVRLRVLCPSFGNTTPVFDIVGKSLDFSPPPPTYAENAQRVFQETCRVQLFREKTTNTPEAVVLERTHFLSTGNNYTVIFVGDSAETIDEKLYTDTR